MIVLDTNVLSEPMRPAPDKTVTALLNRQQSRTLFTTTVTIMELHAGLEKLTDGKRKTRGYMRLQRPTLIPSETRESRSSIRGWFRRFQCPKRRSLFRDAQTIVKMGQRP